MNSPINLTSQALRLYITSINSLYSMALDGLCQFSLKGDHSIGLATMLYMASEAIVSTDPVEGFCRFRPELLKFNEV